MEIEIALVLVKYFNIYIYNIDCCHDGNLDYYPGYPIHNLAFLFRGATPLINRIFGKTGKSDLAIRNYIYIYVVGSLTQGIEGYTEFKNSNYLMMTDAIGKGEFMDQYQIHHIYWIYLNNYAPKDLEIFNIDVSIYLSKSV